MRLKLFGWKKTAMLLNRQLDAEVRARKAAEDKAVNERLEWSELIDKLMEERNLERERAEAAENRLEKIEKWMEEQKNDGK